MTDFENFREQKRKWREEKRKMKDEWRSKIINSSGFSMMGGVYMKGRAWTGVFILLIGVVALLKTSNVIPPEWDWIYSWPVFLIALGLFIGIRHNFHGIAWLILIIIGGVFLADHAYPGFEMHRYTWPIILISLGLFYIFRPRRRWAWQYDEKKNPSGNIPTDPIINNGTTNSNDDYVNVTSVFGETKKNVLSKNFKGGEIVNIFGGTELNLSQADINGEAIIELTIIFGGIKLIIPSNWTVKSDVVAIFGGVEDKRLVSGINEAAGKTITLKGTVIFGGIDIKSY